MRGRYETYKGKQVVEVAVGLNKKDLCIELVTM